MHWYVFVFKTNVQTILWENTILITTRIIRDGVKLNLVLFSQFHCRHNIICFDKSVDKIRKYVCYMRVHIYRLIFDIGGFICSFKGGQ